MTLVITAQSIMTVIVRINDIAHKVNDTMTLAITTLRITTISFKNSAQCLSA
jgi:hypothetical protein